MSYTNDPNILNMAGIVAQDADAKGKVYSELFDRANNTTNDIKKFMGPIGSSAAIWVRKDLAIRAGTTIKMTSIGDLGGPGVLGETELTPRASKSRFGGNSVEVDYWRDAAFFNKKQVSALPAGKSLETVLTKMLGEKFGRQIQNSMIMKFLKSASGNVYRVGGGTTNNALLQANRLSTAAITEARGRALALGANPIKIGKSESGSELQQLLCFGTQDAFQSIRNSSAWTNAIQNAAARSTDNPAFSGRLLNWNAMHLWEHTVVNQDADDYIGSAMQPLAKLGVAVSAGTTTFDIQASTSTLPLYFQFFPGYDWKWTESQSASADSTVYYAWIINTQGADAGKAMFVSYTGSANNGNKITILQRLGASATGDQVTTLGSISWNATYHTNAADVNAWIIPANSKGTPSFGKTLVLGAGAGLYAEGQVDMVNTRQQIDFDFVQGRGVEGIMGYGVSKDTQGTPRGYVVIEHACDYPGISIPGTYGV